MVSSKKNYFRKKTREYRIKCTMHRQGSRYVALLRTPPRSRERGPSKSNSCIAHGRIQAHARRDGSPLTAGSSRLRCHRGACVWSCVCVVLRVCGRVEGACPAPCGRAGGGASALSTRSGVGNMWGCAGSKNMRGCSQVGAPQLSAAAQGLEIRRRGGPTAWFGLGVGVGVGVGVGLGLFFHRGSGSGSGWGWGWGWAEA